MDTDTLLKLKNNPHYKLSQKQEVALAQADKKPMVEFGEPKVHNGDFNRHDVTVKKKKRKSKVKDE